MGREYRIQQALKPVFPLVPEMRAHCTDTTVIGAEFYVMERLAASGAQDGGGSTEKFGDFMRAEQIKWAKIIKDGGVKGDA